VFKLLIFIYSLVSPDCTFKRRAELERFITDIILTVPQQQKLGWLSQDLEQQLAEHLSNSPRKQEEEEEEEEWDTWDDEQDEDDDFGHKKKKTNSQSSEQLKKKISQIVSSTFDKLEILTKQRSNLKIFE
jgi:flagellar biosynthesis component FlhA